MADQLDADEPLHQAIVERRDELGQLLGRDPVLEHVVGELADIARRLHQRIGVMGGGDRFRQLAQRRPLHRKQVALRKHTEKTPFLHHRQMAYPVLRHGERAVIGTGIGRVKMPMGISPSAVMTIEPMRSRLMRARTSPTGVLAAQATGARRRIARSGLAIDCCSDVRWA